MNAKRADDFDDVPLLRRGDRCYSVIDDVLHVQDQAMKILKKVSLPMDEKAPQWRELVDQNWSSSSGRPSDQRSTGPWHLVADPFRERILANNLHYPTWVFASDLDGKIEWIALLGAACCNFACLVPSPDRILHASSCGFRVSSLSAEGKILRQTQLPKEYFALSFVSDEKGGGILTTLRQHKIRFDADAIPDQPLT